MNISTRQKWHTTRRNLKVDDLVIIKEDTPRNQWHLGRVVETKKESDGLVRRVKVLVGERTSVETRSPYQTSDYRKAHSETSSPPRE